MTATTPTLPPEISLWNDTQKDYPLDRSIVHFIDDQVKRTPTLPAVVSESTTLSYAELNTRANQLASHLSSLGVHKDSLVGVYMERSAEMVVGLLGIVKAGGAYVPIDPEYPADRLAFMFRDSEARIVLTQSHLDLGSLPPGTHQIALDGCDRFEELAGASADDPPHSETPDSLVYMIYTSGSTGRPKGVPNTHRGLLNRILWMQDAYKLTEEDRVLQKTPYSFDVSVWEFFWPLVTGASIVMARPGGHRDNDYLVDTIVSRQITTMHFVPSMLNLFLNASGVERIDSLRQVMSSGEALPYELARRFFERLPTTRLHNLYGPTEAAIDVTYWECSPDPQRNIVPIGFPIANTRIYILDSEMNPVPIGESGELHIGGVGLARGYWKRPDLTRERFVSDPFSSREEARLYKTGDLARYLPDGAIEYLGRLDYQVKLRGFRIELGEVEAILLKHPAVQEVVVTASDDHLEEKQLVAYAVSRGTKPPSVSELRQFLLGELPDYMVPSRFVFLDTMPTLPNGKIDRSSLPRDSLERPDLAEMYLAPRSEIEKQLCGLWGRLLGIRKVGIRDNFFELGGNSVLAIRLSAELRKLLQHPVPVVRVFQFPTIEKMAHHLSSDGAGDSRLIDDAYERATRIRIGRFSGDSDTDGVAVIGMAGRFPGAQTVDELWRNLCAKVESITRFSPDELGPGIDEETLKDPNYVPTRGIIEDADKFDARFFGIGPLEAKVMDPQQRVFLELAWAALENAGYDPERFPGMIGVYAGVGDNHYYTNNVLCHPELVRTVGNMIVGYGNEKDYIATRVSYALNLTGPSVSANTGCSTSLLALDGAFKSLIDFECDMALAGGVDIFVPQRSGQLYQEGGTFTKDGHCRPFDAEATGTMFCDGAGLVVLRRLEDAMAAGDRIYAIVRGVAKNNDGANKVSFLAPSVEGQARVIALAQAQANVSADTIGYVEAHGTGTPLGDPIEIEALTKAFRATTDKKRYCFLGSIKGNIGHPTIASGIAGFVKACLALHNESIPATLHFRSPNPKIDFDNSPFVVVKETTPWPRGATPRRAAVSSFGFGGTNVHAILEEAPAQTPSGPSRPRQLLLFSAKTDDSLNRVRRLYAELFEGHPDVNLADVAYTLAVGRRHHAYRDYVVCADGEEARSELEKAGAGGADSSPLTSLDTGVVFMFPGQGSQFVNMGLSLYSEEPVFRRSVDVCCDILREHLDRDLRELLFPDPADEVTAAESLKNTYYTQPALFVVEYSLAQLWMNRLGVSPVAVVGHSVGEFVCACLSGVFSLEDVLPAVALRGRLIRGLPAGSMLSVRCPADGVRQRLPADIQLAASNSPSLSVVAGPSNSIAAFSAELEREGIISQQLHTSHAFHSAMMDPIVGEFVEAMSRVRFSKMRVPMVSTCTADWLTDDVASSPEYWGRHLRMPVLFSDAISKLLAEPARVFLEVGPREVLTTLARQHVDLDRRGSIVSSMGGKADPGVEWTALLAAAGSLWTRGVGVDWSAFYDGQRRHRLALPTYPFERDSHWVEPVANHRHRVQASPQPVARDRDIESTGRAGSGTGEDESGSGSRADRADALDKHDEVMTVLGALLKETLGVQLDSRREDMAFIALGADSLLLMQLSRAVKTRLGLSVSFRQLVEQYSTPRQLAEAARAIRPDAPAPTAEPAPAEPTEKLRQGPDRRAQGVGGPENARDARVGMDAHGNKAWFIPDQDRPGEYLMVAASK